MCSTIAEMLVLAATDVVIVICDGLSVKYSMFSHTVYLATSEPLTRIWNWIVCEYPYDSLPAFYVGNQNLLFAHH